MAESYLYGLKYTEAVPDPRWNSVQLWNPEDSGTTLEVTNIVLRADAADFAVTLLKYDTALVTLQGNGLNTHIGKDGSLAEIRTERTVIKPSTPPLSEIASIVAPNREVKYKLDNKPIIIQPGWGLIMIHDLQDLDINVILGWNELTISGYPALAHYFESLEIPVTGARSDAVDSITAMTIDDMYLDRTSVSAASQNVAIEVGVSEPKTRNSGFTPRLQADWGGLGVLTTSAEFKNLGSDDWMMFAVGHHLTVNVGGTNLIYGNPSGFGGNPSYIHMAAAQFLTGDYDEGALVVVCRDTLSNDVSMPQVPNLAFTRRAGVANPTWFGSKEPYVYALYRRGNTITRRIIALLTNETLITEADCSGLLGDVHPNAGWFWADFITYGHQLWHFTSGTPVNIDDIIDYMGNQWADEPLNKIIHPDLIGIN